MTMLVISNTPSSSPSLSSSSSSSIAAGGRLRKQRLRGTQAVAYHKGLCCQHRLRGHLTWTIDCLLQCFLTSCCKMRLE
ncbi:unnamed protein product [Musa hybrid cultivar]